MGVKLNWKTKKITEAGDYPISGNGFTVYNTGDTLATIDNFPIFPGDKENIQPTSDFHFVDKNICVEFDDTCVSEVKGEPGPCLYLRIFFLEECECNICK